MRSRLEALGVLGTPFALAALAPAPAEAVRQLSGGPDPMAPLLAAVALTAWGCIAWLVMVLSLTVAGGLPGCCGRLASRCAGRVAPRAIRNAVRLALGVSIAASTLAGPAAWAADGPGDRGSTGGWSLDWPTTPSPAAPRSAAPRSAATPPATTPAATAAATAAAHAAQATPSGQAARARTGAAPQPPVPATASPGADLGNAPVVVRPGDCLWDLAAARLGADATARQIAQAWPQWWSANRAVLGDTPDLLLPGTHLHPPSPPTPPTGDLR